MNKRCLNTVEAEKALNLLFNNSLPNEETAYAYCALQEFILAVKENVEVKKEVPVLLRKKQ